MSCMSHVSYISCMSHVPYMSASNAVAHMNTKELQMHESCLLYVAYESCLLYVSFLLNVFFIVADESCRCFLQKRVVDVFNSFAHENSPILQSVECLI